MEAFKAKFVFVTTPVLLIETELFQNTRLIEGQPIEEYFSKIIDKGRRLQKTTQVLLKFIEGLPP